MKLPRRRFLHLAAGAAALPAVSRIPRAQAYPGRPITMIVPFAAGGPNDRIGRIMAERMQVPLGQPFTIEWTLHPKDYVFKKGHRIGVVITGNLSDWVSVDTAARNISVTLKDSQLVLPVASGMPN